VLCQDDLEHFSIKADRIGKKLFTYKKQDSISFYIEKPFYACPDYITGIVSLAQFFAEFCYPHTEFETVF
jgi:hypothetical protein